MGLVARVLSFTRLIKNDNNVSDVKVDTGGGNNITGEHFANAGDDSVPLPSDFSAMLEVQQTGRSASIGYIDPKNNPVAEPGEKRIYARDKDTGAVVGSFHLKNNGDIKVANDEASFEIKADGSIKAIGKDALGSFELKTNGEFLVNGAIINTIGDVVTALGRSLDNHIHPAGTPPGNTGPPV